jgi:hypothetical protein
MDVEAIAEQLLDRAVDRQQAVMRCGPQTPTDDIRACVRILARRYGIKIRTGMIADVLCVVRSDAAIWQESAETMRVKLTAPDSFDVVA